MNERDEAHTSELRNSQEEAERIVQNLQQRGWDIYPERVPLQGQGGYYCVRTIHGPDGMRREQAHSVRWNLFDKELCPVILDCQDDRMLLSFLWQHAQHDGFDFFEYGDGDVGFVCYCKGALGKSLVLQVEIEGADLGPSAYRLLEAFEGEDYDEEEYDDDDEIEDEI